MSVLSLEKSSLKKQRDCSIWYIVNERNIFLANAIIFLSKSEISFILISLSSLKVLLIEQTI